jgi:hypothetical protein
LLSGPMGMGSSCVGGKGCGKHQPRR